MRVQLSLVNYDQTSDKVEAVAHFNGEMIMAVDFNFEENRHSFKFEVFPTKDMPVLWNVVQTGILYQMSCMIDDMCIGEGETTRTVEV